MSKRKRFEVRFFEEQPTAQAVNNLDTLQRDLSNLAKARAVYRQRKELADAAYQEVEELRQHLLFSFQANKIKSLKNDQLAASLSERVKIRVENEPKVIDWLSKHNLEPDHYLKIDEKKIEPLAKAMLKEDGEILDGTKLEITEYVSLREVQK